MQSPHRGAHGLSSCWWRGPHQVHHRRFCAGTGGSVRSCVSRPSLRNILHIERQPILPLVPFRPHVPICLHINHLPLRRTHLFAAPSVLVSCRSLCYQLLLVSCCLSPWDTHPSLREGNIMRGEKRGSNILARRLRTSRLFRNVSIFF